MIGILFLFLGISAAASDQIPDVDMHALTREVMTLQKFLFSESEFKSPKNDASVRDSLAAMEQHLSRLETKVFTDQPALRANASMLSNQILEADQAFKAGDKAYARYVLEGSLQMCVACHTRTASHDFALPPADLKDASTLERANFYFATRQFDLGRAAYEEYLSLGNKKLNPRLTRAAALALATYYARIKADPAGGREYFLRMSKGKKLSQAQWREYQDWAFEFGRWADEGKPSDVAMTDEQMMKKAKALLKGDIGRRGAPEIRRLRASALLHAVLESPGETSPLKAEALQALGNIYEVMDMPLYTGFGDMYLKACISDYKKSKTAEQCYQMLESFVRKRTGPKAPEIEEGELRKWKSLAY
ncbi:MAG: hypothetical protein ACXVCI_11820 [Bdellovibrionota bacterium]